MAKEWIVPDADLGFDGAYFDYQELVRCRECDGWVATGNSDLGLCALTKRVVTRRDYCSEGKRKDGTDNA